MAGKPWGVLGGLLLFLELQAVSLPQAGEQTVTELVKHSTDAVVQVVVSDSSGKELGLGSGFILSPDGQIVTNYHVIKGAHSAIVKLTNGAFFPVDGVLAEDPERDLAILKVPGKNLPSLTLAEAERIQVGEHVVAIGSPLGLQNTVSDGIISAVRDESDGKQWVQTTAPASPGNSGGPLLEPHGQVVGVITWGVNLQLGQNLNFAAPSSGVKFLLAHSHEVRPLGSIEGVPPVASAKSVWTSLTTGHDYKVRMDGDYIYAEWLNMPTALQGTSAFMRSEVKKDADGIWRGKSRSYLPCQYRDTWTGQLVTKWCRGEYDIEVDKLSDSRIEGKAQRWDSYDCRKCDPKGARQEPFTFIPKD